MITQGMINVSFAVFLGIATMASFASASIRILPLGDSLTSGHGFQGGYRKSLYTHLEEKGYDVDFLGETGTNINVNLQDNDHEGHYGWTIKDTDEYLQDIADSNKIPDPDVILLLIGSEDMADNTNHEDAIKRWDALLSHMAKIWPYAHILASELLPRFNAKENGRVNAFNNLAEGIVNKQKQKGAKISFVKMNNFFTVDDLEDEKMHLTVQAYRTLGHKWANEVKKIMVDVEGDDQPPYLIRAEGSDKEHLTLTFSKPLDDSSKRKSNFEINKNVNILGTSLTDDNRQIVLTTSEQSHNVEYTVSIIRGVFDRTALKRGVALNQSTKFRAGWRFLVMSDWHSAEKYVFPERTGRPEEIARDVEIVKYLKTNFAGDFILMAGDTNAGAWDRTVFKRALATDMGKEDLTREEAVLEAGRRCYGGMMSSFRHGGYSKVLLAHGDHEAGDNPWKVGEAKSILQPQFRKAMGDVLNSDRNGYKRYREKIGDASARPTNTQFSDTAYAYVHKNTLIVTVDAFYQVDANTEISHLGTVANRIVEGQLDWLRNVLEEARLNSEIKFKVVQSHVPVLHPVRKNRSSGQMMELEENSDFWKTLREFEVDIYFTGEVHLNTVTKDKESNLVQIASRGNYFNNFLTVDITDDTIFIKNYNEVGEKEIRHNLDYNVRGALTIRKGEDENSVNGWGELAILDQTKPVLHFNFEEIFPLNNRYILGLGLLPDVKKYTPLLESVTVNGVDCRNVLPNVGEFGSNYDAQVANIDIDQVGIEGKAGLFDTNSRAGIWAMGPHFGGREVSYALWIKTRAPGSLILISYEGYWIKKTCMNLRLVNGRPEMVMSEDQKVVAKSSNALLNDGDWHHIAVSNSIDNGLLSQIRMYVDGVEIETVVKGVDETVYFPNGGVISLGGFGHGRTTSSDEEVRNNRLGFTGGDHFKGSMDEVYVWARAVTINEVQNLAGMTSKPSVVPTRSPTLNPTLSSFPSPLPTSKLTTKPSEVLTRAPTVVASSRPSRPSLTNSPSLAETDTDSISVQNTSPNASLVTSAGPSYKSMSTFFSTIMPFSVLFSAMIFDQI